MRKSYLLLQSEFNSSTILKLFRSLQLFQDDSNADNQNACLEKTSKTLGQCILDCKADEKCKAGCVTAFEKEHSKCPCQVGMNEKTIKQYVIG